MVMRNVVITVDEVTDVPSRYGDEEMALFVECAIGNIYETTECVYNTPSPLFNAQLTLQNVDLGSGEQLLISVRSPEGGPRGTAISYLTIDLDDASVVDVGEGDWYDMDNGGKIFLKVCTEDAAPADLIDLGKAGAGAAFVSGETSDVLSTLEGPRPGILRFEMYYSLSKMAYCTFTSLPLLRNLFPLFEGVVESALNVTPLTAPSPEEGSTEKGAHPTTAHLDRLIEDALAGADSVVDTKKDETIAGMRSMAARVAGIKPRDKSLVDLARGAISGAANSMSSFVGSVWSSVASTAQSGGARAKAAVDSTAQAAQNAATCTLDGVKQGADYMIKGTQSNADWLVEGTKSNADWVLKGTQSNVDYAWKGTQSNVDYVVQGTKSNVGSVVEGAKGAISTAVNGAKGAIGGATNAVTSSVSNAVSTAASTANTVKEKAFGSAEVVSPEAVPVSEGY